MSTFTASVETRNGTFQHPFHLGTDVRTAMDLAQELFTHRYHQLELVTIALMLDGRMYDVYDGTTWSSEDVDALYEEDDYDGQPDEAQEWHDFDPDC